MVKKRVREGETLIGTNDRLLELDLNELDSHLDLFFYLPVQLKRQQKKNERKFIEFMKSFALSMTYRI